MVHLPLHGHRYEQPGESLEISRALIQASGTWLLRGTSFFNCEIGSGFLIIVQLLF
jgi:hypothetical protein